MKGRSFIMAQNTSSAAPLLADTTSFERRDYSQKERDAMDDSDFGDPENQAFPIKTAQDVINAASRLHNASGDQEAIKARIKRIAKRKGFPLPQTWQDEVDGKKDDGGRAQSPDLTRARDPELIINPDGTHAAFTGLHVHAHSAFGSQGDDDMHEHEHEHNNDANHEHEHTHLDGNWKAKGEESDDTQKAAAPDIVRSQPTDTTIYAPILRIDRAKREVVVRATAEDLDSYGTVIGFDGSKEAFGKWRGNIREMHDPSRAVGRAIEWTPVEDEKAIDLTLRVSKGAQDTWEKVLDGTLSGASIGARNGKWGKKQWQGKEVPYLERYDLVEVSLVDNPSCPGCDVKIVRADGCATDILDFTEERPQPTPEAIRYGARVSADTRTALHKARDHALQGAKSAMESCNCAECQSGLNCLDPDGDGDIDILTSLDTDNDGAGGNGSGDGIMNAVKSEITRHLAPTIQRINGIAARLATTDTTTTQTPDPELMRRFETLEQRLSGLDEVRSLLSEVKGLAEKSMHLAEMIAAQPAPGGPIVNSAVLRSAQSPQQPDPVAEDAATIARLAKAGILNKNQQVEAVLYLQRLEREQMQPGRR